MLKPVMLGLDPWAIRSALLEAALKRQSLGHIEEKGICRTPLPYLVASMVPIEVACNRTLLVISQRRLDWKFRSLVVPFLGGRAGITRWPKKVACRARAIHGYLLGGTAFASVTSSRNEATSDRVLLSSLCSKLYTFPSCKVYYRARINNTSISLPIISKGVPKREKNRKETKKKKSNDR